MSVRVFLLVLVTVLFGAIWSSDRQYQQKAVPALNPSRRSPVHEPRRSPARSSIWRTSAALDVATGGTVSEGLAGERLTAIMDSGKISDQGVPPDLLEWGAKIRSAVLANTCWLRWRFRQRVYFEGRQMAAFVRQNCNWEEFSARVARDMMALGLTVPRNAAAPRPSDAEQR